MARDRIGIKPVYYVDTPNAFLFASEIKSFFQSDEVQPQFYEASFLEYLYFRDIAGENTAFKGVKRLLPGHYLVFKDNHLETDSYWSIFHNVHPSSSMHIDQAEEELEHLIDDAVKIRMISDVPLGTFCSGGIDSSLVTALASQYSAQNLNTFSVGFHERDFDETHFAQLVSSKYATHHHEIKIDNQEYTNLLPDMIWHNDEPLNFANSIQIYAISRLSKRNVTVVLTGEGADELFAGYPRIQIPRILALYQNMPELLTQLLIKATTPITDNRIQKLRNNLLLSPFDRLLFNASVVDRDTVAQLLPINNQKTPFSFRHQIINRIASLTTDVISQMCLADQSTYLVSILNRQDKMSMAASIESRVPFLDYRIIEFSNRLPTQFKLQALKGKRILKRVARKYLPNEVVHRKKSGFGVPLAQWMRSDKGLGPLVQHLPSDPRLPSFIDKRRLSALVFEHRSAIADHSEILWSLLNLTLWRSLFKA
jgi:asparagine synthase (glutamine-hydrolysing)